MAEDGVGVGSIWDDEQHTVPPFTHYSMQSEQSTVFNLFYSDPFLLVDVSRIVVGSSSSFSSSSDSLLERPQVVSGFRNTRRND